MILLWVYLYLKLVELIDLYLLLDDKQEVTLAKRSRAWSSMGWVNLLAFKADSSVFY